jgi:ribonuclease D
MPDSPAQMMKTALDAAAAPVMVESSAQLARAEKAWRRVNVLSIDTEFVRERTYRADLGLLQLSDGQTVWLVDPLTTGTLEPFTRMLTDTTVTKVLHGCSEDLEVLLNTCEALPDPLIDTQVACALLGQPLQMGYHATVKWLLDIDIDKDQTRSNWCRRPLKPEQLRYAALDVCLLPMMWQKLSGMLKDRDREHWLTEECERMKANALKPVDPDSIWQRFRSAGRLRPESLAVLGALAAWREREAMRRNMARGFVMKDPVLLAMARSQPQSVEQMDEIEDLHPGARRRYETQLIDLIAEINQRGDRIEPLEELNGHQRAAMKMLRNHVATVAREMGADPALLASRRELEVLLREHDNGNGLPERFQGWRKTVIADDLLKLLEDQ